MGRIKKGDTVYRLLPSGTLFTYIVQTVHKDGRLTVMPQGRGFLAREQTAPKEAFSLSPETPAKPF